MHQYPLWICHPMILVVQSSQKTELQQKLSFPPVLQEKHEELTKPTWFRLIVRLYLAHHLATIARS